MAICTICNKDWYWQFGKLANKDLEQHFANTIQDNNLKKWPRTTICKINKMIWNENLQIANYYLNVIWRIHGRYFVLSWVLRSCTRSGHCQWPLLQAYYLLKLCTQTKTKCTDDKKSFMRSSMEWNGCFLLDGRAGWTHMHVEAHFEINSCL